MQLPLLVPENFPAGHEAHTADPIVLIFPSVQAKHSSKAALLTVPSLQVEQEVLPALEAIDPLVHGVQISLPAKEAYLPICQASQDPAPALLIFPPSQAVQKLAPLAAYLPALHSTQLLELSSPFEVPAGQAVQEEEPSVSL